ncbi:MAG: class I SAM-dependent methyltransferase [Pseudomonadota bacterium]
MDQDYLRNYKRLCKEHWWWRSRLISILKILENLTAKTPGVERQILDVGCADGVYFEEFGHYGDVKGLEPDPLLFSASNAKVINASLMEFDGDDQFDIILMLDVLEHIEQDEQALARIHALLKKDGHLILTVPAFNLLYTRHDEINRHYRRYSRASLKALFSDNNWSVERQEFLFVALAIMKLVVRLRERLSRPKTTSVGVPPRFLNRIALAWHGAERMLFGVVSAPFGSSLLVVARKK